MATHELDFYFDFISPYAHLAHAASTPFCAAHGVTLRLRPVLFAAMLNHWGQRGPAEIAPKREFTFKDVARRAAHAGVALRGPASHPFNPVHALRASLPEVAGDAQARVVAAIFDAGWGRGIEMSDPAALERALTEAGLDGAGLLARAREPAAKDALRRETDAAVALGVFGVPTMRVRRNVGSAQEEEELFWGADQWEWIAGFLAGRDPVDKGLMRAQLARPASATRK